MELYMKASTQRLYRNVGIFAIVAGGLMLVLGSSFCWVWLAVGVSQVLLSHWFSNRPLVKLANGYLHVQLAPLASLHLVRMSDISELDASRPGKLTIRYRGKEVTIGGAVFDSDAFADFREWLEQEAVG